MSFKNVGAKTILMQKEIVKDFSWDFKGVDTKEFTHGVHSYPAMMIPQVARRLIQENGKEAKLGLDPFCGSGSVLLEFNLAGIKSYGVDINPLAVLISRVKNTVVSPEKLRETKHKLQTKINETMNQKNIETPNFFNIDFWFKTPVIKKLAVIKKAIDAIEDENIRNFFLACFSETVRKTSNTRAGEFKLYRINHEKLVAHNPDAYLVFKKIIEKNIQSMENLYNELKQKNNVKVIEDNILQTTNIPEKSIDLLVTSPPYGDSRTTVAYGQFSRLGLQWLGISDEIVRKLDKVSLGGIASKSIDCNLPSENLKETIHKIAAYDEQRAREVLSFFEDFYEASKNINSLMKDKSTMCFVVGNRTVKGVQIPTAKIITEFFKEFGFENIKTIIRNIPSKKMPRKNSPSNKPGILSSTMNQEHIVILKRD